MSAKNNGFFILCVAAAMTLILGVALMGCGSNDEEGATDSGAGTTGGNEGGAGATGGADGGSNTGGSDGGANTGGTGGTGGTPGIDGGQCDTDAVSVTTCGTMTCPAVDTTMAQYACLVNCCVDDKCGRRMARANAAQPTQCRVGDQPDSRCEDFTASASAAVVTFTFVGCCTADNQCGGLFGIFGTSCTSRSQLKNTGYSDVPAPKACDETDSDDSGV